MAVEAVFLDVGETIVDESRAWLDVAARVGMPALTLLGVLASSAGWGVEKPAPEFFARIAVEARLPPEKIAYVGDRVDNDIEPALAAGMIAVHIRRGPWGYLQDPPADAICIRSLDELPAAIA
jgi:FMN phosphatase YigB (HAD superfamily)